MCIFGWESSYLESLGQMGKVNIRMDLKIAFDSVDWFDLSQNQFK
jgi:hypothetical protein